MSDPKSMMSKFDDLLLMLENAKKVPFSNYIMLNHDEISNLILELKELFPEEIRTCSLLLQEKDSFMERTQEKADRIIQQAEETKRELIKEESIYKEAEREIYQLKEDAKQQMMEALAGLSNSIIQLDKGFREKLNVVYSDMKEAYKPINDAIQSIQRDWENKS